MTEPVNPASNTLPQEQIRNLRENDVTEDGKHTQEARHLAKQYLDKLKKNKQDPNYIPVFCELALCHVALGRIQDAETEIRQLSQKFPDNALLRTTLAEILVEKGDGLAYEENRPIRAQSNYEKAEILLKPAAAESGIDAQGQHLAKLYADVLGAQKKWDEALEYTHKRLNRFPQDRPSLQLFCQTALLRLRSKLHDERLHQWVTDGGTLQQYSMLLLTDKNFQRQALHLLRHLAELHPDSNENGRGIAVLSPEAYESILNKVVKTNPALADNVGNPREEFNIEYNTVSRLMNEGKNQESDANSWKYTSDIVQGRSNSPVGAGRGIF